jgi:hypothetical protein
MSSVRQLHDQAMALADKAFQAGREGRADEASKFFAEALEAERSAASLLIEDESEDAEPTRSFLLRSAATIALHCGQFREAERLSAIALSGDPPEEIAEELRDVLVRANLGRPGLAPTRAFLSALQTRNPSLRPGIFNNILYRIMVKVMLVLVSLSRRKEKPADSRQAA